MECLASGGLQERVLAIGVERPEGAGRLPVADLEIAQVLDGHGGVGAAHGARQDVAHGHGAHGRDLRGAIGARHGPVHPSVGGSLQAGCGGFHEVLRVEVGAGRIGRSGGVYDSEVPLVPDGFEGSKRRVQAEETIQVDSGVFAAVRYL